MNEPFKSLVETSGLWLPALTWLVGQASATETGRRVTDSLKSRLKWLKDPQAEKAFYSAFRDGIVRYEADYGRTEAAQAVAKVLTHVASHETSQISRKRILDQIFASQPDPAALADAVRQYAFAMEGMHVSEDEVSASLETLVTDYLRPAFRKEEYYAERVGFAEVIGLLMQIGALLTEPGPDLEALEKDYCSMIAQRYDFITMQGISPKVQNRTIGIRMQDVFIPLEADITGVEIQIPMGVPNSVLQELFGDVQEAEVEGTNYLDLSPSNIRIVRDSAVTEGERSIEKHLADMVVEEGSTRTYIDFKSGGAPNPAIPGQALRGILAGPSTEPRLRVNTATISRLPQVVVQGDPGGGKSTLTRYIAWEIAANQLELVDEVNALRLPIRIRAIEFGEAVKQGRVDSLEEYLLAQANRFSPLVLQRLMAGEALVLIDGLDEVSKPALRVRVKEAVDNFVADPAYADNHILITTRIVGYERDGLTGKFSHFTLAELNDQQIEDFVGSWYRAIHREMAEAIDIETERKQLLEAVLNNESIHRMARNPLLLTIIALIKWQGRALPDQRVLLYDAAAQTLIRSWPLTQRKVELDELFIREWLAPVAHHILEGGTSDLIDEYSLMDILVDSMMRLKAVPEMEARQESQDLLEDVSLHSGILLPRGTDEDGRNLYGFLHQTFAEYLTAYRFAGMWEDDELDLGKYAHDPYWREVILLTAGHLGTQRRAKGGRFLEAIRTLNSSPYEQYIHRDLLLACQILADGVPIGPGDLVESLLQDLIELWIESPISSLQTDVKALLGKFRGTEYASVLARLARENLGGSHILQLARQSGLGGLFDTVSVLLQHPDTDTRLMAAELLAEQDDTSAIEALREMLGEEKLYLRLQAARILAARNEPRAIETLVGLLGQEESFIRHSAMTVLADQDDPHAVEALIWQLGSQEAFLRQQAAEILAKRDNPDVVETLLRWLSHEEPLGRIKAVRILATRDAPQIVEELVRLTSNDEAAIQLQAARILAERGDPHGVEASLRVLADQDPYLRLQAALILVERHDPRGLEALGSLLDEQDPHLRLQAAQILAVRGDQRGIEVLLRLLGEPAPYLRLQAARILTKQGDPRGAEALATLLDEQDPRLRHQAARVLAERDDQRGIEALAALLDEQDPHLRLQVSETLVERDVPRGMEALVVLLGDEDSVIRHEAARILAEGDDSQVVDLLIKHVGDDEATVRLGAAKILAWQDDPRVVESLVGLLDDDEVAVRWQAASALAESDDPIALQTLKERMTRLLEDTDKTSTAIMTLAGGRSVADVAYQFLKKTLAPDTEEQTAIAR